MTEKLRVRDENDMPDHVAHEMRERISDAANQIFDILDRYEDRNISSNVLGYCLAQFLVNSCQDKETSLMVYEHIQEQISLFIEKAYPNPDHD